ncbi:MAG: hypothetical protein OJF61_002321 [Rhodanobacteraceae bacterium]|jgi:hypothetical protein|nr:MAG: hypothetical protein OJF61_002321 [Rhodanobacteraceae bacterium]
MPRAGLLGERRMREPSNGARRADGGRTRGLLANLNSTSLSFFARLPGGRATFLCVAKEGGPKKGHPGAAPFVHPWTKGAIGPAGLADAPSLARRQVGAIPCAHPAGLLVRPSPQHRGPGSASTTAILASLEARPHSLRCSNSAQDARPMGPLEHGERTADQSEGWRTGSAPVRRRHRDVPSANPGGRSRILSTWMCSGRVRGVAFSLLRASCPPPFGPPSAFSRVPDARVVTFSWPSKRKSPARAGRGRKKTGMSG